MELKGHIFERLAQNKWLHLLMNAVFFAFLAWMLPIHFGGNDEVLMCLIANGVYSGSPDGHLVFINANLGWVIAGAYMLNNSIEWYSVMLSVAHVLAMTGISYLLIKDRRLNIWIRLSFLAFLYVVWIGIIISFQFTTTSGLLCLCGCLALLGPSKKWRVFGVGMVLFASLVRFDAAALVGAVFSPLLINEAYRKKKNYVLCLIGVGVLAVLGHWGDKLFYKSPEWTEYLEYNSLRGFINDNPNAWLLEEKDMPEDVSIEDYYLLCSFQGDPEVISLSKLRILKRRIEGKFTFQQVVSHMSELHPFRTQIMFLCSGLLLCFLLRFLFIGRGKGNNKSIIALIASFLVSAILLFAVCMVSYMKSRVFFCVLLPLAYQVILYCSGFQTCEKSRIIGFSSCVVLWVLCFSVFYLKQDWGTIKSCRRDYENWQSYQKPLLAEFGSGLLYPRSCDLSQLNPFSIKDLPFSMVYGGWFTKIPFNQGVLDNHLSLVDNGIAYFGSKEDPPEQIAESVRRNYGVPVQLQTIIDNEQYAIYIFARK